MEEWNYKEFMSQVAEPDDFGCRAWTGKKTSNGYGSFPAGGYPWTAHRWLMIYLNDGVNPGPQKQVRHMCFLYGAPEDNKLCVTPKHLKWGTRQDNVQDQINALTHVSLRYNTETFDRALDRLMELPWPEDDEDDE
jgi:hypothetical protein